MTLYRCVSNGQIIIIEGNLEIAHGGEGRIYKLTQYPQLLAKIYDQPTNLRAQKLLAMRAAPPIDPMASKGHASIAWPEDILQTADTQARIVGFLMPFVPNMKPLADLYNPQSRRQISSNFNYLYLHRTARNIAAGLHALHDRNYIVGDVNESNILVKDTSLITFVDTDSFQVRDTKTGIVWRCPVGKPEYTPPEIQGQSFDNIDRNQQHDLFGLAVLIFMILMEGNHPFAGKYLGTGDPPPVETRIASGHFPYSRVTKVPYDPPPVAPPFNILDPVLQNLLVRCFENGYKNPSIRPDSSEWMQRLEEAEMNLVGKCSKNSQHIYGKHLNSCPWCERTKLLNGRDPFGSQPSQTPVPSAARIPTTQAALQPATVVSAPSSQPPIPPYQSHPRSNAGAKWFAGIFSIAVIIAIIMVIANKNKPTQNYPNSVQTQNSTPVAQTSTDIPGTVLALGSSQQSRVTNISPRNVYSLYLTAGQQTQINVSGYPGQMNFVLAAPNSVSFNGNYKELYNTSGVSTYSPWSYTFVPAISGPYYFAVDYRENNSQPYAISVVAVSSTSITTATTPAYVGTPIQYGQEVTGKISNKGDFQNWKFDGQAGDIITIHMVQDGGASLSPSLSLYDPSGTQLTNGDGNTEAWIKNYTLVTSETYTIRTEGISRVFGYTVGGYRMNLALKPPTRSITYGQEVSGQIEFSADYQDWKFVGHAGDIITIHMVQNGGASLSPSLSLYDPSGTQLTSGDGNTEAWIKNYTLHFSGTYIIRMEGINRVFGYTIGGYRMDLALKPPPGSITYGQEVSGQIEFSADYQDWKFVGHAGDIITIHMVQNGGASLSPSLSLYDPSGTQLISGDGNTEAWINNYTLHFSGTYIIRIEGINRVFGYTIGGYQLSLTAIASQNTSSTTPTTTKSTTTSTLAATKITFTANRDGYYGIYTMNYDASNQISLTKNIHESQWSAWSPDGQHIAFTAGGPKGIDLYVMNADGSNQVRLTTNTYGITLEITSDAWSPDGRRIAFSSYDGNNRQIYLINADGSNIVRITNNTNDDSPAWSPDGRQIAFSSNMGGNGNWQIYVMNSDGSNQWRLTNNTKTNYCPVWSSDGRRIAFTSGQDSIASGRVLELYVMNADGSNQVQLTNDKASASSPTWSPDSQRIAFTSNTDLYVINADGSHESWLATGYAPAWSPFLK